jgi:hypothetical protein
VSVRVESTASGVFRAAERRALGIPLALGIVVFDDDDEEGPARSTVWLSGGSVWYDGTGDGGRWDVMLLVSAIVESVRFAPIRV